MKAQIFMKFETYIHNIVKNDRKIFHKDPCTHVTAGVVNVRTSVSSRQNERAHVYALCARVCARIFTDKTFDNSLLSFPFIADIFAK